MKLSTPIFSSALFLLALSAPLSGQQLRPCTASQLREAKAEAPEGGAGNEAAEVAVTNVSHRSCTLDGVPHLTFLDGHGRPATLPICANCSGYVFHAAPPQTVTLAPGGSAHFLIGFYDGGYPGSPAADVSQVRVAFVDHPLRFALFGGDTFAISGPYITAWRPGIEDTGQITPQSPALVTSVHDAAAKALDLIATTKNDNSFVAPRPGPHWGLWDDVTALQSAAQAILADTGTDPGLTQSKWRSFQTALERTQKRTLSISLRESEPDEVRAHCEKLREQIMPFQHTMGLVLTLASLPPPPSTPTAQPSKQTAQPSSRKDSRLIAHIEHDGLSFSIAIDADDDRFLSIYIPRKNGSFTVSSLPPVHVKVLMVGEERVVGNVHMRDDLPPIEGPAELNPGWITNGGWTDIGYRFALQRHANLDNIHSVTISIGDQTYTVFPY